VIPRIVSTPIAPLVLPPVVTGYALLSCLGRSGWLGRALLAVGVEVPFSFLGAVVAALVRVFAGHGLLMIPVVSLFFAGMGALGVAIAMTSAAIALLHLTAPHASVAAEIVLLTGANAAATITRFYLLRVWFERRARLTARKVADR